MDVGQEKCTWNAQTFGPTYMTFVYFIVWKEKVNEQGIEYM